MVRLRGKFQHVARAGTISSSCATLIFFCLARRELRSIKYDSGRRFAAATRVVRYSWSA